MELQFAIVDLELLLPANLRQVSTIDILEVSEQLNTNFLEI